MHIEYEYINIAFMTAYIELTSPIDTDVVYKYYWYKYYWQQTNHFCTVLKTREESFQQIRRSTGYTNLLG